MVTDNNTTEMQKEKTFLELIKEQKIKIPIIQRDYAQGRLDNKATEIRDGFLTSIIDALRDEERKPLILGFVYGSTQNGSIFVPLDGQQRLTTLFLLHWYLAVNENLSIFRTQVDNSTFSKFTYETRISSKDFCNSLTNNSFEEIKKSYNEKIYKYEEQIKKLTEKLKENENTKFKDSLNKQINRLDWEKKSWSVSSTIKDQSWFMWSWRKDPTVKAMLVMLDEMNLRFNNLNDNNRESMWRKLENGKIAFHLLPLEKFDLTDELYIKMNARGKELSKFDIFKSTLEEQMRLNNVDDKLQDKWRSKIDNNWVALFWNKLAKPKLESNIPEEEQKECVDSVEDTYLKFFKRMIVYHLFINDDCFECDWNNENIKRYVPFEYDLSNILDSLREYTFNKNKYRNGDILNLMPLFSKTKFFSRNFFEFVIQSFKFIIYHVDDEKHDGSELIDNINFDMKKSTVFETFIDESIDYETRVQFFAILQFYKYNKAEQVSNDEGLKKEFNSWMRIIRNLSTNTNTYFYNVYDDLLKSLKAIERWASEIYGNENKNTVIDFFVNKSKKEGFNNIQLSEEAIKAELIKKTMGKNTWKESIRKAEEHKYFLGQIGFLLEWSNDGEYNFTKFNEYYDKICSVFGNNGLNDELCNEETNVFRNALMSKSNYLLNDSFMNHTGKDRDWSWKRYLRENDKSLHIKTLLDEWDKKQQSSFEEFCINYIKQNKPSNWRKYFIEKPELYNLLEKNRISWWNMDSEEIILLKSIRKSAKHWELRTYYWYLLFKKSDDIYKDSKDETDPFCAVFYRSNNKKFWIQFFNKWDKDNGWQVGRYTVSSNYDPQIQGMDPKGSDKWEQTFNSDKTDGIETVLKSLNEDTTIADNGSKSMAGEIVD